MQTKKVFIQTAATLRAASLGGFDAETLRLLADFFADDYERENPRFDRLRFLTACGLQGAE